MKKAIIHQFDPVIYPFKLWVSISSDGAAFSDRFKDGDNGKELNVSVINEHEAVTYYVQQKEKPTYFGVLIVFSEKKYCTCKLIAHESTHAARFMWEHVRENGTGWEADAYLVGWIAECCEKVKLNKF